MDDINSIELTVPKDEDYGVPILRNRPGQLFRELDAYALLRGESGKYACDLHRIKVHETGLRTPLQHLCNAIQILWPNEFLLQVNGIRNNYALDVLNCLCNSNDVGIAGCASSSKCLGKGTPIRMADGSIKPVEDIQVGDSVMGDDQSPRLVTDTATGRSKLYKIIPYKGKPWICNEGHILTLKCNQTQLGRYGTPTIYTRGTVIDIPIEDYVKRGSAFKRKYRAFKVPSPMPESVQEFDPYIYGAWIADGGVNLPMLHKPLHTLMAQKWISYFEENGYRIKIGNHEKCPCIAARKNGQLDANKIKNPFTVFVRKSIINGEKRILPEYLRASLEQRRKLLAGILDGDGCCNGSYFVISTKYNGLADDIQNLCDSLALFSHRSIVTVDGNDYQLLTITGACHLIPTLDKKAKHQGRNLDPYACGFDVEEIGEGDYFGFTSSGNHRFLLGDGTVTHNTYATGAWVVADWFSAPFCTSTYIATTTLDSSEDRLWGTVVHLYRAALRNMKYRYKNATVGHLIDYRKIIAYEQVDTKDADREYRNAIKALAFPKGNEGAKAVETTRGRKNERMRLIIDELAEMDLYVLDARANLQSNPDFVFAGLGNPAPTFNNPHTELCQPADPRGWDSVTINTHLWETRTGIALHLNGLDSPNYQVPEDQPIPYRRFLHRQREREILKTCLGNVNHLQYWRNIYGWWPDSSAELTVFSKSFISSLGDQSEPRWHGEKKTVAGFDTGFTAGGDRCALTLAHCGRGEDGRMVGYYIGTREIAASVGEVFEDSIAKQIVAICIEAGVKPHDFGMDISSDGGKVMGAIIREWMKFDNTAQFVYPISSMGTASDRPVSAQDTRPCSEAYDRRVTELWFSTRIALQTRSLLGLDLEKHSEVANELCSRQYLHKGKRVAVETKDDLKKRIKKSPDRADSFCYLTEMLRRAGVDFADSGESEEITARQTREFERKYVEKLGDEQEENEEDFAYSGSAWDGDGF